MYEVRTLEHEDIQACLDIAAHFWDEKTVLSIYNELKASTLPDQNWPPHYFVTELDSEIVGFAGYRRALYMPHAWEFTWCNVHPDFHRTGVGRLLTELRLDAIRHAGGKIVQAASKNPQHLFQAGFVTMYLTDGWFIVLKTL
jgi:GNAT superfamily N-acetyltransferase